MLSAFKIKEFDLQPVFEEWKDAPIFTGNPKKDLPVKEWLDKIKEGCVARGVPEEYWYKAAQHFMGPKAKARLDELKEVITKVHGGKYRWTWKKFRVAMLNMGWAIDKDKKETIKVQGRSSGMWFTRKKDTTSSSSTSNDMPQDPPAGPSRKKSASRPPPPSRSSTILRFTKAPIVAEPEEAPELVNKKQAKAQETSPPRGRPVRSASVSGFWPNRMNSTTRAKDDNDVPQRPGHQKAKSDTTVVLAKNRKQSQAPSIAQSEGSEVITTKAEAPAWLLNACTALEFITSEHPKAMSIISAILITAGSIPAIPAIAAGAGGAVLASGAVHAIGAIAVAAGQALGAGVAHAQKQQAQSAASITDGGSHH